MNRKTDKKELKDAYRNYKPDMGVYAYQCLPTGKVYLGYGQNMKGDMNSITFQLKLGSFITNTKCNLQNDWKEYGEANFKTAVLETLSYQKDEEKTDYTDDLRTLRDICSERFKEFEYIQK